MPVFRFDLKVRLTLQVAALAAACFIAAVLCVLYATNRAAHERSDSIADVVAHELDTQWSRVHWLKNAVEPFPDLQILSQTVKEPGLCIGYRAPEGQVVQRLCDGIADTDAAVPPAFAALYVRLFGFGTESIRAVRFGQKPHGEAFVSMDGQRVIGQGWRETGSLIAVLATTLIALCVLIYATLAYALRPTRTIRAALERLSSGDLAARLPVFDLAELSTLSPVFNSLAAGLDHALAERRRLTERLIAVQDDERCHLARDLHDEFGQCLAAIDAMAASASQTAHCRIPEVLPEIQSISKTARHMAEILRSALLRLRPPEIEELGLIASLEGLVAGWNAGHLKTRFSIEIDGQLDAVPPALSAGIFRIAQEAVTNAAKHADASSVVLRLTLDNADASNTAPCIELRVEDDGTAGEEPALSAGMGLLGIRERVDVLGGHFALAVLHPSGLALRVRIPLPSPIARQQPERDAA
jgi:signal transduction histidine kinase